MMDVVIVGAGPAGLAAAQALRDAGLTRLVVLERDAQGGGVPRHCGHPGFGWREFGRVLRGPAYAEAMVERSRGIAIRTGCSVTALAPGGRLTISTEKGMEEIA